MSAFTKFTRHPAMESSTPSTLTAQMPREFVRATTFSGSHQMPRQVPVSNLEDLSFRRYNQFQDNIDRMGFKPIAKQGQFIPPPPTNFSIMEGMVKKQLVPPDNLAFQEDEMDSKSDSSGDSDSSEDMSGKGLKKGSPAMKAHMARLRAMRKKK